ncbi:Aste57867_11538 [Aphanomyces stellatus]|uniref:Aste57867_11538 protein n=1 Tax=Aphanomyces stellatus TaxID=120398 RepID=A0A485KV48_9STRA|nr:hypothetical protein As57867_011495 [Aphanomyces stellatus]VFT88399.1 Aste57867_11538 [Aphanomyces stellatus]
MVSASTITRASLLLIVSATAIASTWTCVNGPIASDGNIECWSDDGRDCAWGANCAALVATNAEPKQPLVCLCSQYSGAHWCNVAKAVLGAHPPCTVAPAPTPTTPVRKWTLVDGIPPVKIASDGNVECWSDNGRDCAWGANYAALSAPNHWCNIGKAALGAHPPTKVVQLLQLLPHPPPRHHDGNIECWSNDGRDCAWGANYAALVASNTEPKQPLVCLCNQYSGTHWCNIGKAALGAHPPNEGCTVAPAHVLALNLAATNTFNAPKNTILVFVSMVTGAGLALAAVALNNYRRRIPSTKEERQIML